MSTFHLTDLEAICAAVVVGVTVALLWMGRMDRRDRAAKTPALPLPDAPDAEFADLVDELEAGAYAAYESSVQWRKGVALLNELALKPMKQRPALPAAAPGAPWQLPAVDRLAQGLDDLFLRPGPPPAQAPVPGLVDPGASNDTLNGEQQ